MISLAGFVAPPDRPEAHLAWLEKQRCPKPKEFALGFSFGYGADAMPGDNTRFEQLLKTIKSAGFNIIHCTYTAKRLALCKKHGVKMMVHLLSQDHHVFKSPEKARILCQNLRGNPHVWGYNIWNDTFAKRGEGRRRDVNNVRRWDPTHPAYCGTCRTIGMSRLPNADVMGYYDFHWKRGIDKHFPHLLAYRQWAVERDACFYSWLSAASGLPGKGNFNRNLYSANTGIACGLKGILWFLGTQMMNVKNQEWTAIGKDIIRVNKEIAPVQKELARIGNPIALFSTKSSRTPNDGPWPDGKPNFPQGLAGNGFPKSFWIQPAGGEFLMGVFKDATKRDFIFVANHNAYAPQKVVLKFAKPIGVQQLDRKTGKWNSLEVTGGAIRFVLGAGAGELLRIVP
jgi:hypothetical protein